jgi:hypothetical protein
VRLERPRGPPTDLDLALDDLESLLASPSVSLLGEGPGHPAHLRRMDPFR